MELHNVGTTPDGKPIVSWDKEGKSKREIKEYSKGNYYGIYPGMLKRLALRCMYGKIKYGCDRGWAYPRPSSTYIDSIFRHLTQYLLGDDSEDHLAAAIWNIQALMFNEEHSKKFHDIVERRGKNADYTYTPSELIREESHNTTV